MKPELQETKPELGWLPQLLQTNDSFFPSGTYAHSFGLEGLVQLGLVTDRATLAGFLREQALPMLRHVELPFVRLAYDAALDGDGARLDVLDERYDAMKSAFELRQASNRIGAQRLAMLREIAPHPFLDQLEASRAAGRFQAHAPIVFGVQTALAQTPIEAALTGCFYQSLAAIMSSAMKLLRLGQVGAQTLLTECLDECPSVIADALRVAEEDIGWFNPLLEIASAQHETAYTRVFIS